MNTLWVMTKTTLKRSNNIKNQQKQEQNNCNIICNNTNDSYDDEQDYIPTSMNSHEKLVSKYNELWDTHEKIELDCLERSTTTATNEFSFMLHHPWDTSTISSQSNDDPVQRLVLSVSDWLLDEMERIDSRLQVASQFLQDEGYHKM
mmetsp:Transcript_2692/g.3825  ORF Transcript_2692/g.3825 Transcript_2692/m.3825 type:complete len:147 (+) Transcript_2692:180-620(+)